MSRSAQSQEPRRTIAKTTARGRPPVTSLRKVLSATRRAMPPRRPRRRKKSGQTPDRMHPVPKHAPPPIRAGARSPFVRFVPSSSMSRSAQSQEPRRTIAKTTARGRPAAQSPVSHTPRHATPPAAPQKTLGPAAMPGAPPQTRHENSPVSRTPHAAPPSPRPSHFRAQSGQPRKNWAAPDRMHRPSPAAKTIRQQRPRPKARPPPVRAGGAFPFVRSVPSSKNGRSAQSQRQAPHDRRSRSAAACQAARGRANHSA